MATFKHAEVVEVRAWGRRVGAAAFDPKRKAVAFEYAPQWVRGGIQLAPLTLPLARADRPFIFPDLEPTAFRGLPGLLADALPDRFGNQLIDAWMAQKGHRAADVTVLDRLAYMGKRAMGALEFHPARSIGAGGATPLAMAALVDTARRALEGRLDPGGKAADALRRVVAVGTSAGGARAKAVLGISEDRQQIVSGQFDLPPGFQHWLLKFDGMGPDEALGDSQQYGRIEFAYARMARQAGIEMTECSLLEEGGRAHFMTRRFDRIGNQRIHVQSLCALAHLSFNLAGTHAYESLFQTARALGLGDGAMNQLFRRMAFNFAAANHDDHTRNFAFLLPEHGAWQLAPAFDVTYAYRADSPWVSQHQMSVGGKFTAVNAADLLDLAERFAIPGCRSALSEICEAVRAWPEFADQAGVSLEARRQIGEDHSDLR